MVSSLEITPVRLVSIQNALKISSRKLSHFDFVKDLLHKPTHERRFPVEIDSTVQNAISGVRYYISVGYQIMPKRGFNGSYDRPYCGGVYRLYKDSEVVKIGESRNIGDRFKDYAHIPGHDNIDQFDFCRIEDTIARKRYEKELLEAFKTAYGRLPKYNPITA